MRLIRLLLLAAGAAYAYKRLVADRAGREETQAAEPFSSEQLSDQPVTVPADSPQADEQERDTLERPTWLHPADRD